MTKDNSSIIVKLKALLAAWVTMVFGTSALMALFAPLNLPIYAPNKVLNFLHSTWEIADEIGPAVKISLILVFALLVFLAEKFLTSKAPIIYALNSLLATLTTLLVLGFLPQAYSRGFGIGLTGSRFDDRVFFIYLTGAVLAGLVYSYFYQKPPKSVGTNK